MRDLDKAKIVISDCHLSAGRFFEGKLNPHEDFYFDDEMCDLFRFFSTGDYGEGLDVELVIAGDYFDFLNIPYRGEFEDRITEEMALYKVEAAINGHPKVMKAIREFASLPNKRVTYLVGNHDADLVFPKVAEKIVRTWDPDGKYPSDKVQVINDRDRITYPEGFEIRHGNQEDPGSDLDFKDPTTKTHDGKRVLRLPWSSIYVLKIINRLKWEREYLDKIRPVKVYVFFGMLFDTWFTLRFSFLSFYYFLRTRLFTPATKGSGFRQVFRILKEEGNFFQDLERPARRILEENKNMKTIIMGHTHRPMNKVYPDGKQYINTGTWTKMIDLDWRGLGQQFRRTFALVEVRGGQAQCELRQWVGEHNPHKIFQG